MIKGFGITLGFVLSALLALNCQMKITGIYSVQCDINICAKMITAVKLIKNMHYLGYTAVFFFVKRTFKIHSQQISSIYHSIITTMLDTRALVHAHLIDQ